MSRLQSVSAVGIRGRNMGSFPGTKQLIAGHLYVQDVAENVMRACTDCSSWWKWMSTGYADAGVREMLYMQVLWGKFLKFRVCLCLTSFVPLRNIFFM